MCFRMLGSVANYNLLSIVHNVLLSFKFTLLLERQEVDNLNDFHTCTGRLSVASETPDEADSASLRNEVNIICQWCC